MQMSNVWQRVLIAIPLIALSGLGGQRNVFAESPLAVQQTEPGNGVLLIQVTNQSATPVTALLAEGDRSLRGSNRVIHSMRFFDVALDAIAPPIEPGKSYAFKFFGPNPPQESLAIRSAQLKAAIFADGSTWGDEESVQVLLDRRKLAYQCDTEALKAAMDAKMQHSSGAELMKQLDSIRTQHLADAKSPAERTVVDLTLKDIQYLVMDKMQGSANSLNAVSTSDALNEQHSTKVTDAAISRLTLRAQRLEAARPKVHN